LFVAVTAAAIVGLTFLYLRHAEDERFEAQQLASEQYQEQAQRLSRKGDAGEASAAPAVRPDVRRTPKEIAAIKQEIEDATVLYSEDTLPQFEHWMQDPSPEIRAAAADGLMQSGLEGGARILRAAAAATKDPAEAEAYLQAAAVLELPPATAELVEKMRASDGAPAQHLNLKQPAETAPSNDVEPPARKGDD